jgi:hypothetical protein
MSQGQRDDLRKTIEELRKTSGLTDGKNWLRHGGKQEQRIDEMLLTGATKQDIAQDIIQQGISKRNLKITQARVQRHIDHIRKEEHMLPLEKDVNGIWRFNREILEAAYGKAASQKNDDQAQDSGKIPTKEEIEMILRRNAQMGKEINENVFKSAVEATFTSNRQKLRPDWWEIIKRKFEE